MWVPEWRRQESFKHTFRARESNLAFDPELFARSLPVSLDSPVNIDGGIVRRRTASAQFRTARDGRSFNLRHLQLTAIEREVARVLMKARRTWRRKHLFTRRCCDGGGYERQARSAIDGRSPCPDECQRAFRAIPRGAKVAIGNPCRRRRQHKSVRWHGRLAWIGRRYVKRDTRSPRAIVVLRRWCGVP